jgi:hypothetical protein
MSRVLVSLVLTLLAASPLPVAAQKIYKCKNDKGETFYSQTYDAARCGDGASVMNDQGRTVGTIERRKTAEEIAAEQAAAAAKAAEEQRIAEQRQADQVLLMSYASVADLERVRDEEIQVFDNAIATARLQLESQQRSLAQWLANAAESERAGKPVPENVAANIGKVRGQIEEQNAFIQRKEQEKAQTRAAFEQRIRRFEELMAARERERARR